MVKETDSDVIAASIEEPEQFGVIFDRHATTLFRYLVRRVGVDEADPLLGDVFRVAFERRGTYDCDRPDARPWLYGIATNLLAHHRRSEARRVRAMGRILGEQTPPLDTSEAVASDVDARNLWPQVARALTQLSTEERDTLVLSVWEGLSYDQIAVALAVPIGTVRSRLNRARVRLRELNKPCGKQQ
jgi:RNA polymerase sigma-70 factor (ECF subfamily)